MKSETRSATSQSFKSQAAVGCTASYVGFIGKILIHKNGKMVHSYEAEEPTDEELLKIAEDWKERNDVDN